MSPVVTATATLGHYSAVTIGNWCCYKGPQIKREALIDRQDKSGNKGKAIERTNEIVLHIHFCGEKQSNILFKWGKKNYGWMAVVKLLV